MDIDDLNDKTEEHKNELQANGDKEILTTMMTAGIA